MAKDRPPHEYIATLRISRKVLEKLHSKHDLSLEEVKEAILLGAHLSMRWDYDPERGRRLFVWGLTTDGRRLKVVLYPVDDDGVWRIASAWDVDQ